MLHPALPTLLFALAPVLAPVAEDVPPVLLAQLTIHERIVVRVRRVAPPRPIVWKERKGPKCISPRDLAGVLISTPGSVDMVLRGGKWLRAKLEGECRSLDFYAGIYLKPGPDGRLCADRDVIRARSGASCGIATFKMLEARK